MQNSLLAGVEALRANPLRTVLSTLGIVMGVGAMVSVLSLGDGVEAFARAELERTTDLLAVGVLPATSIQVDGQTVRRDSFPRFTVADASALAQEIPAVAAYELAERVAVLGFIPRDSQPRGFGVSAVEARVAARDSLRVLHGRWLADDDTAVVVLGERAAGVVAGDSTRPEAALGTRIRLSGAEHEVIGVVAQTAARTTLQAYVPVADSRRAAGPRSAPAIALTAARIEDVDSLFARTQAWAARRYGAEWRTQVTIVNRRDRAEQAATAMRVFKLLMAAITGVSLLVGGVGIMNVLLASVAERTREIGIRKATGARDRDILMQFLAESVSITSVGAGLGVLLGLGVAAAAAALMRMQTEADVHAAVTPGTISFAVIVSVLVGLVFGLYPALRAARLSPIDAIRHE